MEGLADTRLDPDTALFHDGDKLLDHLRYKALGLDLTLARIISVRLGIFGIEELQLIEELFHSWC